MIGDSNTTLRSTGGLAGLAFGSSSLGAKRKQQKCLNNLSQFLFPPCLPLSLYAILCTLHLSSPKAFTFSCSTLQFRFFSCCWCFFCFWSLFSLWCLFGLWFLLSFRSLFRLGSFLFCFWCFFGLRL